MTELPTQVYAIAGALLVSNIATLYALMRVLFKAGEFVANTNNGIKDAKECAVRAHERIDKIETQKTKP